MRASKRTTLADCTISRRLTTAATESVLVDHGRSFDLAEEYVYWTVRRAGRSDHRAGRSDPIWANVFRAIIATEDLLTK